MPPTNDLHVDAVLTNLSLKYRNEAFIADMVLPIVKVRKRSDKFFVYDKKETYKLVDSSVGPKAQPNEVDWAVGTDNYSVNDYALADYVPIESIDNADTPLQPRVDTNEFLNEWLMLDREVRVAKLVFAAATYAAANKKDLAAAKWGTDDDDPIANVNEAINGCFLRANTLVFGHEAWEKFRMLPEVLDAVKSSTRHQDTPGGLAMQKEVAELFEVENVLVGRARYNSAKRGQAASYSRVWGKSVGAFHTAKNPGIRSITFGMSFQEMMKQTQTMLDPKRGAKGAEYIKVAYNCDEKLVAKDLGFLLYNVL